MRGIEAQIRVEELWAEGETGEVKVLTPEEWMPQLQIASDVLNDLRCQADRLHTGYLSGRFRSDRFITVDQLHWTQTPATDFYVRLDPRRRIAEREINATINSTWQSLGLRTARPVPPLPIHYYRLLGAYSPYDSFIRLTFLLIYPHCEFSIRQIQAKFKLVASPLTQELVNKRGSSEYRSGFITMDQELRVLPLLSSDPLIASCPLIGVWVTGLSEPGVYGSDARIWATCTQYITHPQLTHRVSASPDSFLVLHFSVPLTYHQVTLQRASLQWRAHSWSTSLSSPLKDPVLVQFPAVTTELDGLNSTASTYTDS